MQQLTGMDASWLFLETPSTPMHIGVVNVFERPDDSSFSPFDAARAQFASRVPSIAPLRRRLVDVPLQLGRPYWVMDPDFDIDAHLHHHIDAVTTDDALAELVGQIMSQPLDRRRPMWEAHIVDDIGDGRWALITKYHHATIDGGAGILLVHLLFDADPAARPSVPATLVPDAEPLPTDAAVLARATASLVTSPRKLAKLQLKLTRHATSQVRTTGIAPLTELAKQSLESLRSGPTRGGDLPPRTRLAPSTPWNRALDGERTIAFKSLPIADLVALKTALGGTINDVVMTMCAGGLRRYLVEHDALPDDPLIALVPMSLRTGAEADPWKNMISMLMPSVATNEADPMLRFEEMRRSMSTAKAQLGLTPDDLLDDVASLAPASMMSAAVHLASRLRLAERVGSPANLTISNVAGPRSPLYISGSRLLNLTPVSLLIDGAGLNITVLSCGDAFDIGLTSCPQAVPDLQFLLDCMLAELDHLFDISGTARS
ncbi:MAG: wax ester/triacylglycerol synthase family O-acyltransferase [Ilumatobacter sp.]